MYVSGIGRTKFGILKTSLPELIYESIYNCLKDTDLSIRDIEAIVVSNFLGGPINSQLHINSLIKSLLPGNFNIPIFRVEAACASGGVAFHQAISLLDKFQNILVVGVEKMSDSPYTTESIMMAADESLDQSNGLIFPANYALIAQKYMMEYDVEHNIFEKIALINHKNSNINQYAHFNYKKVSEEIIRSSQIVSSPLTLFDCSPISDGAVALIITNKKYDNSVKILDSQLATDSISLTQRKDITSFNSVKYAAKNIYKNTAIEIDDIDILEVHDCFTISELIALEDLGFCEKGEAKKLVQNGDIKINGSIPVNTDGGLKANGHPIGATGLAQIYEIALQLRILANKRQINNPNIGMSHNIGGIGGTTVLTLLEAIK